MFIDPWTEVHLVGVLILTGIVNSQKSSKFLGRTRQDIFKVFYCQILFEKKLKCWDNPELDNSLGMGYCL